MPFHCCPPVQKASTPAGRTTRTLTARERQIVQAFSQAVAALELNLGPTFVRQVLAQGLDRVIGTVDTGGFVTALEPMVRAITAEVAAGGLAGAMPVREVVGSFRFDVRDPRAIAYAQTQAGRLIAQVTEETRTTIRNVIARSVENGWTVQQTSQDLRNTIGLHDRWATAVSNARVREYERLLKAGISETLAEQRAAQFGDKYKQRLLKARARNIARTEILTAGNQGRWLSWAQAVEGKYVAPTAMKEWTTGPLVTRAPGRIQVCDLCAGVRGETRRWDQPFSNGLMMPPAHPSCRCSANLVPTSIEEVRERLRQSEEAEAPAQAPIQRAPGQGTPTGKPWDEPVPTFKSANEAELWLQDRWGTKYDGSIRSIKLGNIHPDAAQLMARDMDYLFKQYPSVAERIDKIGSGQAHGYRFGNGVGGVASRYDRFCYFNETNYVDMERLAIREGANKRSGWLASDHPASTLHHEFGHHIHYLIESSKWDYKMASREQDVLKAGIAPILREVLGMKGSVGIGGAKTKEIVGAALSRYGTTNWYEMCAEAFAESMLADLKAGEVRPLAAALRKWLDSEVAKAPLPG